MAKASRFNVQESASQAPGHCFLCRGVKGPFVNTGMSVQFLGVVIICFNCITELSSVLPQEEVEPVIEKVDYEFISDLAGAITNAVDSLNRAVSFHGVEEAKQIHSGSDRESDESSNGDNEITSGEGPSGISSDSDGGVEFPELSLIRE